MGNEQIKRTREMNDAGFVRLTNEQIKKLWKDGFVYIEVEPMNFVRFTVDDLVVNADKIHAFEKKMKDEGKCDYEKGRLPITCPECNKKLDGHMTTEGKIDNPKKGDIGICYYCRSVLEFQGGLEVKIIDVNDIDSEEIRTTIKMALYMVKNKVRND
jgi:hypothetical protein